MQKNLQNVVNNENPHQRKLQVTLRFDWHKIDVEFSPTALEAK
jgi:hypothetical protein